MTTMLEVKNLYKVFGDAPQAALSLLKQGMSKTEIFEETGATIGVQDVSLSIQQGEVFVIMGLSGSGKSTLVRLLNRLIEPTQGEVTFRGQDIAHISEQALRDVRRQHMSMVFQNFALMPHMTVVENTAFGLELAGITADARKQSAMAALARVGLEPYADAYPDALSGGMKQRVGLARALANDPDILLMDEAFSALDPLIRTEMQDELLRLQSSDQRTIVFISHDLDEAMRIGDRIAIMQDGVVVQVGTPDEILHQPANDYVSSFFRGVNVASVFSAGDLARKRPSAIFKKGLQDGPAAALQQLLDHDREYGVLLTPQNQFIGMMSVEALHQAHSQNLPIDAAVLKNSHSVLPEQPIGDVIGDVAKVPYPLPVVDKDGFYHGVISKTRLLQTLDRA